jgi:hypothetical protein
MGRFQVCSDWTELYSVFKLTALLAISPFPLRGGSWRQLNVTSGDMFSLFSETPVLLRGTILVTSISRLHEPQTSANISRRY